MDPCGRPSHGWNTCRKNVYRRYAPARPTKSKTVSARCSNGKRVHHRRKRTPEHDRAECRQRRTLYCRYTTKCLECQERAALHRPEHRGDDGGGSFERRAYERRSTPQIDGSSGNSGALRGNASANSIPTSGGNVNTEKLSTGRSIDEMAGEDADTWRGVDTGRVTQENGLFRRDAGRPTHIKRACGIASQTLLIYV